MRGLILAAACVYAARSHAPAVIRAYFDVMLWNALSVYATFHYFGDRSTIYAYVYCIATGLLILASFAVSFLYCGVHERSLSVYLLCCAIGATAGYAIAQLAANKGLIMACEGGGFLAVGLLMAVSVGCCETPAERLVAAVLAANWLAKATLDFLMVAFDFSPRMLEAGAVLPWSCFLASAVVVGYSFRKKIVGQVVV